MDHTSWIDINLSQLDTNVRHWRAFLDESAETNGHGQAPKICGVVKSDAYGMGAVPVARQLVESGVDMLCTYSTGQAEELFAAELPREMPVLVLQAMHDFPTSDPFVTAAHQGRLHLSMDSVRQLTLFQRLGRLVRRPIPVHLHLDTGMSRGGLNKKQFADVFWRIRESRLMRLAGIYTHFATARNDVMFMAEQAGRFDRILSKFRKHLTPDVLIHVASTIPARRNRCYHRSMVRVGLGLYGFGIEQIRDGVLVEPPAIAPDLAPIIRWRSRIVHAQAYRKGSTIGYDCSHKLDRKSLIGVVPVGYGDGYPISLSNKAKVLLVRRDGKTIPAPVIGKVSMDQITIDLTDAIGEVDLTPPASCEVEIVTDRADSPCALHRLAEQAGSTCYEMLCRISPRVPRYYELDQDVTEWPEDAQIVVDDHVVQSMIKRPAKPQPAKKSTEPRKIPVRQAS